MQFFSRVSLSFVLRSLVLVSVIAPGCGWRTGLDDYSDGSVPSRDGGVLDSSRPDAGRDAGDVACMSARECDDGIICNGVEDCVDGRCTFGTPFDCNDGVPCTRDSCDERAGCVFVPDDASCGPGLICDTFVGCVPGGGCRGDFDCDDLDICNGVERCGPGGLCVGGDPIACPVDSIDCTVEGCDPALGCTSVIDNSRCGPGELCNPMIGCTVVSCGGDGDCDDGEPCNGRERCRGGICSAGTPLSCDDGVDCTVDRCQTGVGCVSSVSPERCSDGLDNDCNGLTDCEDFVCRSRPECGGCMPIARSEVFCSDGRDDDCDGLFDCADSDCAGTPDCGGCMPISDSEIFCSDGRDDDCNGLFDCADFACAGRPECGGCMPVGPRELFCADGRDDDCDGVFDCADPDCAADPSCRMCVPISMREFLCLDGRDDDCDGNIDCADPDCAGRPVCGGCIPIAMTEIRCRGGIDEDCDGRIDCADTDCRTNPFCMTTCTPTAANEIGIAACTNGRDDDCDGRLDCADPDCTPFGTGGECCNGIDDTGDGQVDEFTCYCEMPSTCVGIGTIEQVCWLTTYSLCAPDCRRYGGDTFCRMNLPDLPRCNRTTGECNP